MSSPRVNLSRERRSTGGVDASIQAIRCEQASFREAVSQAFPAHEGRQYAGSDARWLATVVDMPCYHPLRGYQGSDGRVFFQELHRQQSVRTLELPCGRCRGCRLERSRQWAIRCMHEASLHECNCFVTLTYEENPRTLKYRDFQLFMKRLRKAHGSPVRFFMCGEYGEVNLRPHFHACLFGIEFTDTVLHSEKNGTRLFTSPLLSRLWPFGYSTVGSVTFESAAYVARYCMSKVNGDSAESHYMTVDVESGEVFQREPEYAHMSLKPGIGAGWIDRWASDVYPHGYVIVNGVRSGTPRYYDRRYKKSNPDEFEDLQYRRLLVGRERIADNTDARLAVREAVETAKTQTLLRKL